MSANQPYSTKDLLLQIAEGDEKAFGEFVRLYSSKLYTYIYRITANSAESEELVQDIFIQLWQTREALAAVENPDAYLYILSRNRAANALKKMIRERNEQKLWQQLNWLQVDEGNEQNVRNLLDQAVEALPPQQKKIWQMSRGLRMKYTDIALELGISKDAVNKSLQAAGKNITSFIKQHLNLLLLLLAIIFFKNFLPNSLFSVLNCH